MDSWFNHFGGLTRITDHLYRCPLPEAPLDWRRIQRAGIRTVFSLEKSVQAPLAEAHGLAMRPHFWRDHKPPTRTQLETYLADLTKAEGPVVVHCRAGWGRTGTAVCAALVADGWQPGDALDHFWRLVPGSEAEMRRTGQAEVVHGLAARLQGREWF